MRVFDQLQDLAVKQVSSAILDVMSDTAKMSANQLQSDDSSGFDFTLTEIVINKDAISDGSKYSTDKSA